MYENYIHYVKGFITASKNYEIIEFNWIQIILLLWQSLKFNRIRTVQNRCPTVARSMSAVYCCSQSTSLPNHCPIHITCVVVWKVCPANMRMRVRMRVRMRARMREGMREDTTKSKQSHLYNRIWLVKDLFNEHVSRSMSTFHIQWTWFVRRVHMIMICAHKCDRRNFRLFLSNGGGRCLCSIADSGWLSAIHRSTTGCIGLITPLQIA